MSPAPSVAPRETRRVPRGGSPCSVKEVVVNHFLSGFDELYTSRYTKPGRKTKRSTKPPDEQVYFIGKKASAASSAAQSAAPMAGAPPSSRRQAPATETPPDDHHRETVPVTKQPHVKRISAL